MPNLSTQSRPQQVEELNPKEPPSLDAMPQSPLEIEAETYWKRFLPKTSQQLLAKEPMGLKLAIRQAWWNREFKIALTISHDPNTPRQVAEELSQDVLFPPPEPNTTPARSRPTTS